MSNGSYSDKADSAPSEKKVWRHIHGWACPFEKDEFYAIQELLGAWAWNDEKQKEVFTEAVQPASTRVVKMRMDDKGTARNVHASYPGKRVYKDG